MAVHICRKCQSQFTVVTRGRPPSLCTKCKGAVESTPAVVQNRLPRTQSEVREMMKRAVPAPSEMTVDEPMVVERIHSTVVNEQTEATIQQSGMYEVIVTNLGHVYKGDDEKAALNTYDKFVNKSVAGYGQVGREKVKFLRNGEQVKEFNPAVELK